MRPITYRGTFLRGATAGMLLAIAADSVHWFITPAAHQAGDVRRWLTIAQGVICLVVAIWLARHIPGEPELEAELKAKREDPRALEPNPGEPARSRPSERDGIKR
jgi:hypothetical protein